MDEFTEKLLICHVKAELNDIRWKLLVAQSADLAFNCLKNRSADRLIPYLTLKFYLIISYLNNLLNYIVSERILDEIDNVILYLFKQFCRIDLFLFLVAGCLGIRIDRSRRVDLDEFLYYTYAICVLGDSHETFINLIIYELPLGLFRKSAKNFLHNVSSLKVLGQLNYMALECLGDKRLFRWSVDQVKHELNCVGTSFVAADLYKVVLDYS